MYIANLGSQKFVFLFVVNVITQNSALKKRKMNPKCKYRNYRRTGQRKNVYRKNGLENEKNPLSKNWPKCFIYKGILDFVIIPRILQLVASPLLHMSLNVNNCIAFASLLFSSNRRKNTCAKSSTLNYLTKIKIALASLSFCKTDPTQKCRV